MGPILPLFTAKTVPGHLSLPTPLTILKLRPSKIGSFRDYCTVHLKMRLNRSYILSSTTFFEFGMRSIKSVVPNSLACEELIIIMIV